MDGIVIVALVAAAGGMAAGVVVVRRRRTPKEPPPVPIGDTRVLDSDWLTAGAQRYEALVVQTPASVEATTAAGVARQRLGDVAAALFFYQKAIDVMQAEYVINGMRSRGPSSADQAPIDRFLSTLALIREQRPAAPITASVLEVTHRLRTMTTACKDEGQDPTRYLEALDFLSRIAPDIDVSNVYWKGDEDETLRGTP